MSKTEKDLIKKIDFIISDITEPLFPPAGYGMNTLASVVWDRIKKRLDREELLAKNGKVYKLEEVK